MAQQLPPVAQPIGIFDNFIARGTETIVLREKLLSLTGDSFDISLANGQPIFKVDGRTWSARGKKSMYDTQGNHLMDISKEIMHIHDTYVAKDPSGNKFLEIKNSLSFTGAKSTASFTSKQTGQNEILALKGNWVDSHAEITNKSTGAVVARIDRNIFKGRDWFGGASTYALIVAPGVDMAIMCAICIALDEVKEDNQAKVIM